MRLFRVLPILSLLFGARASSLGSRSPVAHPLDVRDLDDVCASVDTELKVPLPDIGIPVSIGLINSCLCLSTLHHFLETNVVAQAGVAIAGELIVTDILTSLIVANAAKSGCKYPDNSEPACVNGNPCGFTCTNGFSPSPPLNPTTCACKAPNMVCNGQCKAPGACPSSGVVAVTLRKRRWVGSGSCTEMGPGWAACAVYGGGARAWECVNTAQDLESCGGCVLPLTPFSPIGQDCTAIPGVADVACHSGKCKVRRCMSGYVQSHDGTSCISKHDHISQPHITTPGPEEDEEFMQTIRYGLEHRPL